MLYPIQNDFRNRLDLSGMWDFQTDSEETGELNDWVSALPDPRPMAVPGSWNEQYADLYNYFGLSWYLKRTFLPQSWQGQRIFLRVGSANYYGKVYINGRLAGEHEGGHLPFAFDITDHVIWAAENVITISVENHLKPTRVPSGNIGGGMEAASIMGGFPSTTFDFFPFAGIHRPVVLFSVPETFITDITATSEIAGSQATVKITARINASQAEGRVILRGETARESALEAPLSFKDGLAQAQLVVPEPHLWSDQYPYLYDLSVVIPGDRYTLSYGIRTIAVQDGQILLNGRPVKLNGFGRHEDFIASGRGLNLPLMVKDYDLMRWTGANSYRTSHYPYSEEEMMLADRQGFLIIDEIPAVSLQFDTVENMAERKRMCLQQLDELIARDKNHPSVVMWSVANEPMPANFMARLSGGDAKDEKEAASTAFLHDLVRHARQLDPTRLVTLVGVMGGPIEWLQTCDVICINRYWGWYFKGGELEKGIQMIDQELDGLFEALGRPIIVTEFGADTQPGLHGNPALMWTEEYQAALIRGYLEVADRKPFVAGMHVWNFADFAAVQSIMRVGGMNMKGVFTRARQPKLAAHVLREFWTKPANPAQPQPQSAAQAAAPGQPVPATTPEPNAGPRAMLETLVQRLNRSKPAGNSSVMFDLGEAGVYRLVVVSGVAHIEDGDGEADATVKAAYDTAQKLFTGKISPAVALMTGKIKISGNPKVLMMLQD